MTSILNKMKPELRQWITEAISEAVISKISILLNVFKDEIISAFTMTKSEAYVNSVKLAMKHLINFFGPQMELSKIGVKEIERFLGHLMTRAPKGYRVYSER